MLHENEIAVYLRYLARVQIPLGIIVAIILIILLDTSAILINIFILIGSVFSCIIFYGFSEIVQLLSNIDVRQRNIESEIKTLKNEKANDN